MIITTTPSVEGKSIVGHLGVVVAEAFIAEGYTASTAATRESALHEMQAKAETFGADAVVGLRIDYIVVAKGGRTLLMVSVSGTAVKLAG